MIFSKNLKRLREQAGLSRKDMAEKIGVSLSAYTNYEAGNRSPNIDLLPLIADALHVSIDELLGYTPKQSASQERLTYWLRFANANGLPVEKDGRGVLITYRYQKGNPEIPSFLYSSERFVALMEEATREAEGKFLSIRNKIAMKYFIDLTIERIAESDKYSAKQKLAWVNYLYQYR